MPTIKQAAELIALRISPWELVGDPWFEDGEWHAHYRLGPSGPLIHGAFTINSA
jgi:hypothetical protein